VKLNLTPLEIHEQFVDGQLDKNSVFEALVSFIENDPEIEVRVQSIEFLGKIDFRDIKIYAFLKQLLTSGSDSRVRGAAAKIIVHNFLDKGIDAIQWALEHDISLNCATTIINALKEIDENKIQPLLIDIFQNFIKTKTIDGRYNLSDYFKELFRSKPVEQFLRDELILMFYNFKFIRFLVQKFNRKEIFSFLAPQDGFVSILELINLDVTDMDEFEGLEHLTRLEKLVISGTQIKEIKGLENFTRLHTLEITRNLITEIKGLDTLTNLSTLNLSNNQITEIKGLENLKNLIILKLGNNNFHNKEWPQNKITKIQGLDSLTNLWELHIPFNAITEISGIGNLIKLDRLFLNDNEITDIKGLESNPGLGMVGLNNNRITEISGLDSHQYLTYLYLSNNQVKEIKGVENLPRLSKLDLSYNNITEIKGLENLSKSTGVDLTGNPIIDRDDLKEFPNVRFGDDSVKK